MANDTTRMEKLADDLSAVTIPSCKHMEREEYRDCVLQMLDDLEQLGRRDGCIAAAWALDALPSLQRELAEANLERNQWRSDYRRYTLDNNTVGFVPRQDLRTAAFGPALDAKPVVKESLTTAQPATGRAATGENPACPYHGKAWCHCKSAPAPSDVKGDQLDDDELTRLANMLEVSACGHRLAVLGKCAAEIESLKSRASLTPLTDPSVRGVLVNDGEPRALLHGDVFVNSAGYLQQWAPYTPSQTKYQVVKLRPASDFGVADADELIRLRLAYSHVVGQVNEYVDELNGLKVELADRGEPGLKKLPDGARVIVPHDETAPGFKVAYLEGWWQLLDPALYAIPDGGEREDAETVEYWSGIVTDKNQRIKELEAELADWKADTADQLCVNCSDPLEYQQRADAAVAADAERLRKAIEDTYGFIRTNELGYARLRLLAVMSPTPAAASGEKAMKCLDEIGEALSTSAPAAETQGNAQHHIEGAKIPEGGSGSPAAESEGKPSLASTAATVDQVQSGMTGSVDERSAERLRVARGGAESEGGEREIADSLNALRNVIGFRDEQGDRALRLLASLADQRDALSARLAACEAGIKDALPYIPDHIPRATLMGLLDLLAPKAGGEDGK